MMDRYGDVQAENGGTEVSSEPEPAAQPVGLGWSADKPSFLSSVPRDWTTLLTSALEVFEHETDGGKRAALTLVPSGGCCFGETRQLDNIEEFVENAGESAGQ